MGVWAKIILSGSTDGEGIPVTGLTPSTGTVIHTAVTGAADSIDEVYIRAWNSASGAPRDISFAIGPTTATGSRYTETLPSGPLIGLQLVIPGLVLRNAKVIKAYVTVVGAVNIFGYVNRYTT